MKAHSTSPPKKPSVFSAAAVMMIPPDKYLHEASEYTRLPVNGQGTYTGTPGTGGNKNIVRPTT